MLPSCPPGCAVALPLLLQLRFYGAVCLCCMQELLKDTVLATFSPSWLALMLVVLYVVLVIIVALNMLVSD